MSGDHTSYEAEVAVDARVKKGLLFKRVCVPIHPAIHPFLLLIWVQTVRAVA